MLKKEKCIVITFFTIADSIQADNICKQNSIKARLIPTPRQIDAGCGTSLRIDIEDAEDAYRVLNSTVKIDNKYEIEL